MFGMKFMFNFSCEVMVLVKSSFGSLLSRVRKNVLFSIRNIIRLLLKFSVLSMLSFEVCLCIDCVMVLLVISSSVKKMMLMMVVMIDVRLFI